MENPEIGVLMPCRNAMPWLPSCVCSVLCQSRVRLELIVVDDASTDGSLDFLRRVEHLLEQRRGETTRDAADAGGQTENQLREEAEARIKTLQTAAETRDQYWPTTSDREAVQPLAAEEVVEAVHALPNRLRVLSLQEEGIPRIGPSGQGAALNLALRSTSAPLIGEMESDDLRPQHCFATLRDTLLADQKLSAVSSSTDLIGTDTVSDGMKKFASWQNSLQTPAAIASSRFVEIPAMRASALFTREALVGVLNGYRDLWPRSAIDWSGAPPPDSAAAVSVGDCARVGGSPFDFGLYSEDVPSSYWPVDSDFWMRFFESGLKCGKVKEPLYIWRQYPTQSTRTHERCSLERLRECRAWFFTRMLAGRVKGSETGLHIQILSVGVTLEKWVEELRRQLPLRDLQEAITLEPIAWSPGKESLPRELVERSLMSRSQTMDSKTTACLRLFVFGDPKVRSRVEKQCSEAGMPLNLGETDWFAA